MISIIARHSLNDLPQASKGVIPVQLYGLGSLEKKAVSIGNPIIEPIRRLGIAIEPLTYDLLSLALAINAADTYINRDFTADAWTREIEINVEVLEKGSLDPLKEHLESMLRFLSGDIWKFKFAQSNVNPPVPYKGKRYKLNSLAGSDSVCLFSGGMDSTTGVLDLISAGKNPVLVSHAYTKDRKIQDKVARYSFPENVNRFALNASPNTSFVAEKDISMRSRSFNFLCFAIVAAGVLKELEKLEKVTLYIPENGFISINPPLTAQRVGSHSTRTTHPHYIGMFQQFVDALNIDVELINPYQFKTKGEMLVDCAQPKILNAILDETISCSNWKRKNMQCGRCVPCIIRRASYFKAGIQDNSNYKCSDLNAYYNVAGASSDIVSLCTAISRQRTRSYNRWVRATGSLPTGPELDGYVAVAKNGLAEVESYLRNLGVPV